MNIDKKKLILAFLEKNPKGNVETIGIPPHTLSVLLQELADDLMIVKDRSGWRLANGKDLLKKQSADQCIRDMIRIGLSK